jgi:D-alanyl-D-alanine dipeptidase
MRSLRAGFVLVIATAATVRCAFAQAEIPLVNIKRVDPTILIELRYSSGQNIARHALYPPGMLALTRPEVAQRLASAQAFLRRYNYGLKIWDAYRPRHVQAELWQAAHSNDFVADPSAGAGSMHSWALAVDATLVDSWQRSVSMPTNFDDFTPAAIWKYQGRDPIIRSHLRLLQIAMRDAGFLGLRTEWWHFTIENWQRFMPPEEAKRALEVMGRRWEGKL